MDDIDILKKVGLNDAQAEIYECLLVNGTMTPSELSEKTSQSRENCYAILKKLVDLDLIEQTNDKKASYRVLNPSNLEILAEKRRKVMAKNEKIVKDNISTLLDTFYANSNLPGSRTLEGVEGIEEMYMDVLRVKKDVYLLRTRAAYDYIGSDEIENSFLKKYREQLPILGIHTYALTTVYPAAVKKQKNGRDDAVLFHRVWMPEEDYEMPVSIMVYGDKVSFASYSDTPIAIIITSPLIAEAMRQILKLLMDHYKKHFPQKQ